MLAAVSIAGLCAVGACRAATADSPDANTVVIKGFMFSPESLSVAAGSTVIWANMDNEPHTLTTSHVRFIRKWLARLWFDRAASICACTARRFSER
jgi:plastocyanin